MAMGVLWLGLIIPFSTSGFGQSIPDDAQRHFVRGQMAFNDKDFAQAAAEFQVAIKLAPNWSVAWFNLGVAQEQAGLVKGALESFRKFLQLAPNDPDAASIKVKVFELEYQSERMEKDNERKRGLVGDWRGTHLPFIISERGGELVVEIWHQTEELTLISQSFDGKNLNFTYQREYSSGYTEEFEVKLVFDENGVFKGKSWKRLVSVEPWGPPLHVTGRRSEFPAEYRKQ